MTMTKYVPYEKLSKKKQRAMNAKRRETWSISPVTRKPANPKAYNRKKAQDWKSDFSSVPFFFSFLRLPPSERNARKPDNRPNQFK